MKCTVCGVELKDTDKFCGICGTPNPDYSSETRSEAPSAAEAVFETLKTEGAENILGAPEEEKAAQSDKTLTEAPPIVPEVSDIKQEEAFETPNEAPKEEKTAEDMSEHEEAQAREVSPAIIPPPFPRGNEYGRQPAPPPYMYGNIPAGREAPNSQKQPCQKEKRVCSLSAVVFCIVVILILSVACGVLGGMYYNERRLRLGADYTLNGVSYSHCDTIKKIKK